jgi:glycosyltransferase involved in cell wall biosynthesis
MKRAPQRVLLGLESSGPGGAENMLVSLADGLAGVGHQPTIVTDRPGWMTERCTAAALPVWIETQRPGIDWRWIWRLARRMRRESIDLFHSHEFSMNVFGGAAAWLAGVPHVATIHGRHWVADAPRRIGAYRLLRRLGVPVIAVSDDLRTFLAERFGLEPQDLELIRNGVPIPQAGPHDSQQRARDRAQRRAELGLPMSGPLLLCVGNLYPIKDHATLLRAIAPLPSVRLAIAGRGEEEENLRTLAAELGITDRFHLLGLREDVDALLGAADLFVQPSRSEGLPLAVLEAMGHGVPVIATHVGGIPEVIEDGISGRLVPPGNPEALGLAVSQLLADPTQAQAMAKRAREQAEAQYSVDAMVKGYVELYARVAAS